jgi:hypothetical protein
MGDNESISSVMDKGPVEDDGFGRCRYTKLSCFKNNDSNGSTGIVLVLYFTAEVALCPSERVVYRETLSRQALRLNRQFSE